MNFSTLFFPNKNNVFNTLFFVQTSNVKIAFLNVNNVLKKEPSDLYPKEKPILPDWLQNDLLRGIDTK